MDLKVELDSIMKDHNVSYKEARHLLESSIRKLYEAGTIDKAQWKQAKKLLKDLLQ